MHSGDEKSNCKMGIEQGHRESGERRVGSQKFAGER